MLNLKSFRKFSKQIDNKLPRKYKFKVYQIYKSTGSYYFTIEGLTFYTELWLNSKGFKCFSKDFKIHSSNYNLKWVNNNKIIITDYTTIKENNFIFMR